jgi:endoglucanase
MYENYRFFVNDFDRIKNYKKEYPKAGLIFNYPMAFWFGCRSSNKLQGLYGRVERLLKRASPRTPILVAYNIPDRDVGQHSSGGAQNRAAYLRWVTMLAQGIGHHAPILIFEPDAIPHATTMDNEQRDARLDLMREAINVITDNCAAHVYVDVGHSNWLSPEHAGNLLNQVCNEHVRGFSVNVSNYRSTKESVEWGVRVAEYAKNKYFVVDTSRNGNGPYGNDWCNPPGRALGHPPTPYTRHELCDAYLWIKVPGESDGKCNGGPPAGKFWVEQARDLVDNTQWLDK